MYDAAQKRASRQYRRARRDFRPVCQPHAGHAPPLHQKLDHFTFHDGDLGPGRNFRQHFGFVNRAVGLGARALHCRPLAPVQQPELDPGPVGDTAHHTVKRVNLAHKMTLSEPTDGRIARHYADAIAP